MKSLYEATESKSISAWLNQPYRRGAVGSWLCCACSGSPPHCTHLVVSPIHVKTRFGSQWSLAQNTFLLQSRIKPNNTNLYVGITIYVIKTIFMSGPGWQIPECVYHKRNSGKEWRGKQAYSIKPENSCSPSNGPAWICSPRVEAEGCVLIPACFNSLFY